MSIRSKKDLEVELSKLRNFKNPSFEMEQYATPSHIAGEWIWSMALNGEVAGKVFLDAACGPGILGMGLLLMGARKVYFLDKDEKVMESCVENFNALKAEYEIGAAEFVVGDISLFDGEVDIVVQNPPFGTKEEHLDKKFLQKAFDVAGVVYSMHKFSTKQFVEAMARDFGYKLTAFWRFDFPIKKEFEHHKKPVVDIDVGLWRMEKK
jgi:putative methylase